MSYWNMTGRFQDDYNWLWEDLVPEEGDAVTFYGETLRWASRLYYDHYNNGACNFDIYLEQRRFLWRLRTFLVPVARELGIDAYKAKLKAFVSRRKDGMRLTRREMKAFDEVIDAVICWVKEQHGRAIHALPSGQQAR